MDPLSITASVIAVLTLCGQVVNDCYSYWSGVKNASEEMIRITDEIIGLRNVLENLLTIVSEAESASPSNAEKLSTLKLLIRPNGPLAKCYMELERLEKRIEPATGIKAIKNALKWPLREGETRKIRENISSSKSTLTLALNTDNTKIMLALQDDVASLTQTFASAKRDEYRNKLHSWLSSPDPSSNHNAALKKKQSNTGQWFIQSKEYASWKRDFNSFIWLHGIPGCGKTILCSTIIQDMIFHRQSDPTAALAYFYFDFSDPNKQTLENLLLSLVTQMSLQSSETPEALQSLYSRCQQGHQRPSTTDLQKLFQDISRKFSKTFVIIDALDECRERDELLEFITKANEWSQESVHLLATSRKEREIDDHLEPLVSSQICIQSEIVNADIYEHINDVLQKDPKLNKWPKDVQSEISESLMSAADGMFRWVACQLDAIRKCLKVSVLRKTLNTLPKTLNETYDRTLCNIDEDYGQDALKVFQWLAFAARPLSLIEVAEAIGIDVNANPRFDPERKFSEPRDILTICSSMVTISKTDEVEKLKLSHFSVKEYLISSSILNGPASQYGISGIAANSFIAKAALGYLLQFDKLDSVTDETYERFPLSRYAAEYWTHHAMTAADSPDIASINLLALDLFLTKNDIFENWIRLFRPDKPWETNVQVENLWRHIASPLYYVSLAGLVGLAELLLKRGADVNLRGGRHGSALQAASHGGHESVVKLLLAEGADINLQAGYVFDTALQTASYGGNETMVKLLLAEGAIVNLQGGVYDTALQAASAGTRGEVVKLLLKEGADVNMQGGFHGSALKAALNRGNPEVIQILQEAGAKE